MKHFSLVITLLMLPAAHSVSAQLLLPDEPEPPFSLIDSNIRLDLLPTELEIDSLQTFSSMFFPYGPLPDPSTARLTDDDFREVAEEMGVEVAAIKAVVEIETGNIHEGFWAPGKPLINFDLSIYRQMAPKHGVKLDQARRQAPEVFASPNIKKYGSRQAAQQARLDAAIAIDEESALESVFWGMFQIGGFNWKKCGAANIHDFVYRMSRSERDQLELFARFCEANDLVKYIRSHNWAAFSLRYNGPAYKKRGYDRRMATAYTKYRAKDF